MESIAIFHELENQERLDYTIDFLNKHPLLKGKFAFVANPDSMPDQCIWYGLDEDDSICMPAQEVFFSTKKVDSSQYNANPYTHKNKTVYSVEELSKSSTDFLFNGDFCFDVFEAIFFHISRYEEVFAEAKYNNKAGWLEEKDQFLVRNQLEKIPVVDHIISTLILALTQQSIDTKATHSISHDIDIIARFGSSTQMMRTVVASVYHRKGLSNFFQSIGQVFKYISGSQKDPYDVFDWLITDKSNFTEKTIYFMTGGETEHDNRYDIKDPKVATLLQLATQRKYEVGIHPSYNASEDTDMHIGETATLAKVSNRKIKKSRQHFLRWSWDKTPEIISQSPIDQDSSMGYNRRLGFRCGTGYAYHLYDFKTEKAYTWTELPLAYMESSLIHESEKTGKSVEEISNAFLDQNKQSTHIEMNWHNSNFDESLPHGNMLKSLYHKILNEV